MTVYVVAAAAQGFRQQGSRTREMLMDVIKVIVVYVRRFTVDWTVRPLPQARSLFLRSRWNCFALARPAWNQLACA
jgi:hypothetical protein